MSETYSSFTTVIASLMGDPLLVSDPNFQGIMPSAIEYAENRICAELDFLGAKVTTVAGTCTPGTRTFNWTNSFFAVDSVNIITPATATTADGGTRNPVVPSSQDACTYLYPSVTGSTVPQYFGRVTQSTIVFAPFPDQGYSVEVTGTQRPTPLSSTNSTTFISTYLPQLMIAATMIYMSGYQQNFAATADNPQMATSWDTQYKDILAGLSIEESRKKFESEGWSSKNPSKIATPPRT